MTTSMWHADTLLLISIKVTSHDEHAQHHRNTCIKITRTLTHWVSIWVLKEDVQNTHTNRKKTCGSLQQGVVHLLDYERKI